ncbi:MAG TPA: hypothetical protein VFH93_09465 [Thermoleophilia bacterium]|nr:hypothetical protein [Thermoleophilia bacterium]
MGQFILPKDIPLDRYPKPEVFLEEGKRITEAAQKQGIIMRVMGPLALHYYFPDQVDLYAKLERLGDRYFTDIDYAVYGKGRKGMAKLMESLGYENDLQTMAMTGQTRQIYFGGKVPMIDIFFDKLDYCHEIDYAGRLELDPWSVSLADILLQKLQIWEINDKDLKDIEYLFTVADFGEDDTRKVNVGYISRRFADDWGFWYTATTNLDRVKDHVDGVDALSPDQKAKIKQVADDVRARIDQEPKTRKWEKRAKKGTKKIWYNTGFSDW